MTGRREIFMAAVEAAWRDFRGFVGTMPPSDLTVPGVTGDWSVKDVLGHISTFEQIAISQLREETLDLPTTDDELHLFNSREKEAKAGLTLDQVLDDLDATHSELISAITIASPEHFDRQLPHRSRLEANTIFHYADHGQQIRRWAETRPQN